MILHGLPASRGIAVGKAFIFVPFNAEIKERKIGANDMEEQLAKYEAVIARTTKELTCLREKMAAEDEGKAGIFSAHLEILCDIAVNGEILSMIKNEKYAPEYAVNAVYEKFINMLSVVEDDLIRERCADLKDVKGRILRAWLGIEHKNLSEINEPSIVFAHDLLPSDTATIDRDKVLAIVTETGGSTSHSAIIARSYGIPALLGIPGVMNAVRNGDEAIVDAINGTLFIKPDTKLTEEYIIKQADFITALEESKKYQNIEAYTKDGTRVEVCLNIGSASDEELKGEAFTDGVGLFRSEFLFMTGTDLPSEDEQYMAYKKAAEAYSGRQVILRTLDIGGDKELQCIKLPEENNPFLGCRALRLCFDRTELFKTQLRAALRAGVHGDLALMFPMVGSMRELRRAKRYLEECKTELRNGDAAFNESIKVGVMVEIPSIAVMADILVQEVDFASVGTNDLCQYLMAVDRMNPSVADYYQCNNPAMFRLIGWTAKHFVNAGKQLSICGEMAGDPMAVMVFLGLGIKKFSMAASSVAYVKRTVTKLDMKTAEKIAADVQNMSIALEVEQYLQEQMSAVYDA